MSVVTVTVDRWHVLVLVDILRQLLFVDCKATSIRYTQKYVRFDSGANAFEAKN